MGNADSLLQYVHIPIREGQNEATKACDLHSIATYTKLFCKFINTQQRVTFLLQLLKYRTRLQGLHQQIWKKIYTLKKSARTYMLKTKRSLSKSLHHDSSYTLQKED